MDENTDQKERKMQFTHHFLPKSSKREQNSFFLSSIFRPKTSFFNKKAPKESLKKTKKFRGGGKLLYNCMLGQNMDENLTKNGRDPHFFHLDNYNIY